MTGFVSGLTPASAGFFMTNGTGGYCQEQKGIRMFKQVVYLARRYEYVGVIAVSATFLLPFAITYHEPRQLGYVGTIWLWSAALLPPTARTSNRAPSGDGVCSRSIFLLLASC